MCAIKVILCGGNGGPCCQRLGSPTIFWCHVIFANFLKIISLSCSKLRMFAYTFLIFFMDLFRDWLHDRRDQQERLKSFRNAIDLFGLVWFVVGNMWLFGDDDSSCRHPNRSPIYNLCVAMLVINYIQICLPCIIAIILIPVFCFCMPCLIRLLARLHDPRATAVSDLLCILKLAFYCLGLWWSSWYF
jgi:hypothetical protein